MPKPTGAADFFPRAGLPADPAEVIGRKFRFFSEKDGGYELGGTIERYEIHGEFSIDLHVDKCQCRLVFSAVALPYGDGVYRWRLVDASRPKDREIVGQVELL